MTRWSTAFKRPSFHPFIYCVATQNVSFFKEITAAFHLSHRPNELIKVYLSCLFLSDPTTTHIFHSFVFIRDQQKSIELSNQKSTELDLSIKPDPSINSHSPGGGCVSVQLPPIASILVILFILL